VPSPQSNNHSSALWGNLRATLETLRDRVGTPELVPKNVICTAFFNLPIAQFAALFSIVTRLMSKILLRGNRFFKPNTQLKITRLMQKYLKSLIDLTVKALSAS
jgi:hypothetical protein